MRVFYRISVCSSGADPVFGTGIGSRPATKQSAGIPLSAALPPGMHEDGETAPFCLARGLRKRHLARDGPEEAGQLARDGGDGNGLQFPLRGQGPEAGA